jgi:HD-like signal output (HDOD) protein
MLERPLPDLAAWAQCFRDMPIPVQAATAEELALMAQVEALRSDIDADQLSDPVGSDPLMALKLMAKAASLRRGRFDDDSGDGPETVTAALVLMGIGPFFRHFSELTTVEALLADRPDALAGLRRVIHRAHRAANFSLGFAVHRMDEDAPVVHLAALLHDFAEMLLWCHAPDLALQIAQRQRDTPSLRSAALQEEILHVTLADLQQSLMHAWALPDLLARITNDAQAEHPQVRSVALGIRLARHTEDERGWDNPAVPDDLKAIGELLSLSPVATSELVRAIDA